MSEIFVTIICGGVWFLLVFAGFGAAFWLAQWLGLKGYVASFFVLVFGLLSAVGAGAALVAGLNRVFDIASKNKRS